MKETITFGPEDLAIDSDALAHQLKYNASGYAFKLLGAYISGEAAVAKADTNYNRFDIKNGAGTVLATIQNGPNDATGTSIPIGSSAPAAFTLSTTASMVIGPTDYLWLDITKTGNGLAIPGCVIQLDIEYIKPAT